MDNRKFPMLEGIDFTYKGVKPEVIVWSLAFNHEKYILQALDGLVMQKTTFPFLIFIHEDCSTDKTKDIIREYAEQYPDLIRPIYEKENQFSKRDGSLNAILIEVIKRSGARYVAFCECDDFWKSPDKLQLQYNALSKNPTATLCYSGFDVVDSNGTPYFDSQYESYQKQSRTGNLLSDLVRGNFILTVSTMYRADVFMNPIYKDFPMGIDYLISITSAFMGEAIWIPDRLVSYRRNPNGLVISQSGLVNTLYMQSRVRGVEAFLEGNTPKNISLKSRILLAIKIYYHVCLYASDGNKIYVDLLKKHPICRVAAPLVWAKKIKKKLRH